METNDTIGDLLRHRARLLGWVFGACVIPGALLLAAGVAPGIVLTLVFSGASLIPWSIELFSSRKAALPKEVPDLHGLSIPNLKALIEKKERPGRTSPEDLPPAHSEEASPSTVRHIRVD